jgi:diguanylate cyclase (GGDEF)-like protein/PAS domain S-box-containing protein
MFSRRSDTHENAALAQLESLMEAAGDAVFRLDPRGRILYLSCRAAELIVPSRSLVGSLFTEQTAIEDRLAVEAGITQTFESRRPSKMRARLHTHSAVLWVEIQFGAFVNDKKAVEVLVVVRDVSAEQATEQRLQHLRSHDALTGLPNRSLLADRLSMALAQSRRIGKGFSVLMLDLDGFKKVNDALGYAVGDAVLHLAAVRLREGLRDIDTLARVGGDEFVFILPGAVGDEEIQVVARRLISSIQLPFPIDAHTLYVGASIGAATYPDHGDNEVKLLAHADAAMHRAKETGKSRCVVYSHQKFTQPEHDVSMEAAMFEAVRNGEFLLNYQPIVDAKTRTIMGFEALMRWRHPVLGLVSPVQFIPMAESNGLINLLGAWVLKAACVQIRQFEEAAGRPLYVSVNVSPRQFRNEKFLELMDEALAYSGLPGGQLLLEITEGILMSDPEHAEALLHSITGRNVRIAIDDFGTGYSSLAYLKRFPIAVLKIDRAFIRDLPESIKDAAICNVVLSLADHLNLSTVAEGVENERQLAFLADAGCRLIQGYLTGYPLLPAVALETLKNTRNGVETGAKQGDQAPLVYRAPTSALASIAR